MTPYFCQKVIVLLLHITDNLQLKFENLLYRFLFITCLFIYGSQEADRWRTTIKHKNDAAVGLVVVQLVNKIINVLGVFEKIYFLAKSPTCFNHVRF